MSNNQKMDPDLRRMLKPAHHWKRRIPLVQVIVQFKGKNQKKQLQALKKYMHPYQLKNHVRLGLIRSIAVKVPADCIGRLCSCKQVSYVYRDRKNRIHLNVATPAIGASAAQASGWTGSGVTIAILDTGIYPHPDLTKPINRIVAFKDFINNRKRPYDDNGHGTHCAGDAAGNGLSSKGKYKGPAPKAKLVGIKVLDRDGIGTDSTTIRGIDWCVKNKKRLGIRILSLSLGGSASVPSKRDPLCQAVEKAWKQGLAVVTSAGNSGPGRRTISSPGISPLGITVGASNDRGSTKVSDDRIARFSSRGPTIDGVVKPDLVAPGTTIISLRAPGSALDQTEKSSRKGRWYFTLSGTSMSTPIVAGTAAQLLQKHRSLTPNQVKRLLKRRALSLGANQNTQGSGAVDVRFLAR
ncbi:MULTISPECIES: S8 family peptidase [unclassified Paenibacillus]|uniref:S8 family peptidase n=1 Tax=unclassified Paenibacillus TaxID=185978 RepID=UPI001B5F48E0|nr:MULTISPECIES: S8 family peptidase [unclassified Paenibacillus]MBP1155752.1 serine protease AprX [Paenibacillus sp. PvP091]MBP1168862.1 serine protease AprX [Paenibacillus sp. PvR098]MBP2439890.1 serine protease AprX [Paenibacillus sp. PvP052]